MKLRNNIFNVHISLNINNKVSIAEGMSFGDATTIKTIVKIIVATLVVSRFCPEMLSEFIRWILSTALGI